MLLSNFKLNYFFLLIIFISLEWYFGVSLFLVMLKTNDSNHQQNSENKDGYITSSNGTSNNNPFPEDDKEKKSKKKGKKVYTEEQEKRYTKVFGYIAFFLGYLIINLTLPFILNFFHYWDQ